MQTILLVAAERDEFAGLRRHLGRVRRLAWPVKYSVSVDRRGSRWLLVANGMGPRLAGRAADAAREREEFSKIASVGFCGGLAASLRPAQIFVASTVVSLDGGRSFPAQLPKTRYPFRCGTLVSVDRIVRTPGEKAEIRQGGAEVVEMEAAAVAERADRWDLPFYCVRAITDTAEEGFHFDFNALRSPEGRLRRWKVVGEALRHRARLRELLRLRNRCRMAALSLGDFLAGCEF